MSTKTSIAVLLGVVLAGLGATATPVASQTQAAAPLFLALPESFPDVDARAVIMREPGRDIVILSEDDATVETLDVALHILRRMRRDHPRAEGRGQLIPITGFVVREDMRPERRRGLEAALAQLADRPRVNVGNLGWGRWIRYRVR